MSEPTTPQPTTAQPAGTTPEDGAEEPMPTMWEQMGGLVGFISASVPVAVFVFVNWLSSMWPAIWSALGVAVAIGVWRVIRKERLMPAVSGVLGVAIAAFIAYRVGEAKGFFLWGIWVSAGFGVAFLVSLVVRWPLVGVIWSGLNGHGFGWREHPKARLGYDLATMVWTVLFAARVIVQNWLYDSNETTLLGVARLAMGYPLTAVALLVTVWAVARAKKIEEAAQAEAEPVEQAKVDQAKPEPA
ncbi:hypothetical protein JOF53_002406 [Crossiella equi]|uniref:DUF3159 domain-containing protein n=1 Tax=Crossiella equi TaxID=130796 RepID=A0ABS5AAC4_9PSEU|nr:DUF3159 domain-containing protein [Crossiella equi]MBP2473534.1 hypothetical protein [Crossiella equi]